MCYCNQPEHMGKTRFVFYGKAEGDYGNEEGVSYCPGLRDS